MIMKVTKAMKIKKVLNQLEYAWDNLDIQLKAMVRKPTKYESAEEYIRYLENQSVDIWEKYFSRGGHGMQASAVHGHTFVRSRETAIL